MLAHWGLTKNRLVQESCRAEIIEALGKIRTSGFTAKDFEAMP